MSLNARGLTGINPTCVFDPSIPSWRNSSRAGAASTSKILIDFRSLCNKSHPLPPHQSPPSEGLLMSAFLVPNHTYHHVLVLPCEASY